MNNTRDKRVGTGAKRIHWRCPRCEQQLSVDLSQSYDPSKLVCCKRRFYLMPGTTKIVQYNKDASIFHIKSWNEEN